MGIGVVEKAGNIKIRDSGIAYPGSQSRPVVDVMHRKCDFGTITTQNLVMANLLIFLEHVKKIFPGKKTPAYNTVGTL